ncbi:glyoxylase-like metal-dependent hydrolase (beta-lactamase superfamily II) [Nonlabens dokdonensis]|uniref:Zinc dependent hydrolase n=2 Tax=Nonlabens dokdonensis TaxID=328515 RepID=L7WAJ6_NONDD|nr:MBL fold metallo-hydrolase [Nonlabens dokdonensis]AGC75903.1 zinc dependent hydrolase [Nonlabens dokdonensis DSW-6]PZX43583.1 glyoxylase-like metal-dependent hydrolase (beta-lactamase superfamily II) [Nonlabens dokdonensis]
MIIKQFEYKPLSHYSYAVISEGKMAVIDPERDASIYYAFAKANNATITVIIETHPHADFVSSHLEMHKKTGATIYNSVKTGADYPHKSFDSGNEIKLGNATLKALNTPGHSPDSITIVASQDNEIALFTGDTIFIGDVGRPDLREKAGNLKAKREELAEMMYETVTNQFNDLPDHAIIYPAHGAGSLCGKSLSDAASSTLGDERRNSWAFQTQPKEAFMNTLLDGQPFIPSYFSYNVAINKAGANDLEPSLKSIAFSEQTKATGLIVDMRDEASFKKEHLEGSINIQAVSDTSKFETWLGAIIKPEEDFKLVIDKAENKDKLLHRISKIGYEKQLKEVITLSTENLSQTPQLDLEHFKDNLDAYTIIDIRNQSEINEGKMFENALEHPLNELRDTASNIPSEKPIVVHCAGGYRSAAGSSIVQEVLKDAVVYDLSDAVKQFQD